LLRAIRAIRAVCPSLASDHAGHVDLQPVGNLALESREHGLAEFEPYSGQRYHGGHDLVHP
jgi:hypothetical protein